MSSLIPTSYNVTVDINDEDIMKIGLVVYLAILGYHLLKWKK